VSADGKVIISCALTGAVTTKKHCPAIPYTPSRSPRKRSGRTTPARDRPHHARNDDGSPTWNNETFAKIMRRPRSAAQC